MKNINPEDNKNENFFLLKNIILFIIFFLISEIFIIRPLRKRIEKKREFAESEFASKNKESENENINDYDKIREFILENDYIKLTISTAGLVLNNLILKNYFDNNENNIQLLNEDNYIKIGWFCNNENLNIPNKNSIWTLVEQDTEDRKSDKAVLLFDNKQGIIFKIIISIDDKYLINVKQIVENNTNNKIYTKPFWSITKSNFLTVSDTGSFSGAIGLFNGGVSEIKTKKIRNNNLEFQNFEWAGITSKYWLTAIVNNDKDNGKVNFSERNKTINMSYTTKENLVVSENSFTGSSNSIFVGVKDMKVLKEYADKNNIRLLDRSIDFGFFYILAKPLNILLNLLNRITKNFGMAIIILTIIIKSILYPITKKSLITLETMKEVQPKIKKIQDKYKDDKIKMQQELVKLYTKYNLNPMASIFPLFIQIPVFISLYKVISVSLSMRQASFIFINDLSIADPTNILNLFGLFKYNTKFKLGILPCVMGLSMFLQQKFSEKFQKTDDNKDNPGKGMNFMPILFVLVFASFPSGLLLYWIFNNLITIFQQWYIMRFCLKKTNK